MLFWGGVVSHVAPVIATMHGSPAARGCGNEGVWYRGGVLTYLMIAKECRQTPARLQGGCQRGGVLTVSMIAGESEQTAARLQGV